MKDALPMPWSLAEQDRRIGLLVSEHRARLLRFIRGRVADAEDAEDILQDALYELVQAHRLMQPVEQVGAWLFKVARNRITDSFRRKRPEPLPAPLVSEDGEALGLDDLLPSPDGGPEAAFAREVLLDAIDDALDDLPAAQRDVFVAHELEGRSFREIAEETGVNVNTLLTRKHAAVVRLRRRLLALGLSPAGARAEDTHTRTGGRT